MNLMKKIIGFFIVSFLFSCSKQELKKPDFLIGNWIRTNNILDKKTYEYWNADLTGIGFTLQKGDTVFKEILTILNSHNRLYLEVRGVNESPTLFKFKEQTGNSFTCENQANEFPKKIKYWIINDTLHAKVWNDEGSKIDFQFTKAY